MISQQIEEFDIAYKNLILQIPDRNTALGRLLHIANRQAAAFDAARAAVARAKGE
jgi:hypothetical protein